MKRGAWSLLLLYHRCLEKIRVESRDELDSGNDLAGQFSIVRQEQIDTGLGRAGQVDRIGRRNTQFSADPRVLVRRVNRERQHLYEGRAECLANAIGDVSSTHLARADECLADGKGTRTERIFPLLHARENVPDARCVYRMLLEPINEEHGVPVDQAHRSSVTAVLPS